MTNKELVQENILLKARIEELNKKIEELEEKVEQLENRDMGGRRKHDKTWQANYDIFVNLHEQGYAIAEIADRSDFSLRTCYRYKKYYDEIMKLYAEKNADE